MNIPDCYTGLLIDKKKRLQIPGNILITKTLPRWVVPSFAVIWSSVVCLMPAVKSYTALWSLRFILGLAQAVRKKNNNNLGGLYNDCSYFLCVRKSE